ncbi:hypothetical protein FJT64_026779 [Amphibalanus amphitrite]|uniref:Uncharacterized protein n=1 Tax=Amphibalanus amphitrite TaxID=1232801 RepID=A0A6A4WAV7_AMPAM|nr:hypothetical protein FJT64_026779 [Amphibalanus amphitrite]
MAPSAGAAGRQRTQSQAESAEASAGGTAMNRSGSSDSRSWRVGTLGRTLGRKDAAHKPPPAQADTGLESTVSRY